MARIDERKMGVARVYARSLLDLAAPRGIAAEILGELGVLVEWLETRPGFAAFVSSPLIGVEDRRKSLERMFRGELGDLLVDALQVMNRKGRLGLLATLAEAYRQELYQRQGRVEVQVRTASPLGAALRRRLGEAVSRFTGKEAELQEEVDSSLIGGVVLRFGDRKIDGSVARELKRIRANLLQRASLEIQRGKLPLATE